jgi:SAM-dependent methyltransferase
MTHGGLPQWTDQEFLRSDQYRSDENLRARQSIYDFQRPLIDLPRVVVDLAKPEGNETVVDVGCGNALYLGELKRRRHAGLVIGVDMSPGMLAVARAEVADAHFACADASALPVRTGAADVVLAMHMLYHVPDAALAVAELRRITAPGGQVVIGLNGEDHLQEMRAALAGAGQSLGLRLGPPGEGLRLSDGQELMRGTFSSVIRHDFVGQLVLTELAPLESYVRSTLSARFVPEGRQDEYVAKALGLLPVSDQGEFRVKTHAGCLICS